MNPEFLPLETLEVIDQEAVNRWDGKVTIFTLATPRYRTAAPSERHYHLRRAEWRHEHEELLDRGALQMSAYLDEYPAALAQLEQLLAPHIGVDLHARRREAVRDDMARGRLLDRVACSQAEAIRRLGVLRQMLGGSPALEQDYEARYYGSEFALTEPC